MPYSLIVVGPTPPPYHGVSVATDVIICGLRARGCKVFHVETKRPLAIGGRVRWAAISRDTSAILVLLRYLASHRPDIVYIPISQTRLGLLRDSLLIAMARVYGSRVVVHLHGSSFRGLYEQSSRLVRSIVQCALRTVSGSIVLGHATRSQFAGLVPGNAVYVVPNGVADPGVYRQNRTPARVEDRKSGDPPLRVVYLSNLMKAKGYLDLLIAVAECRRRGVPIEVRFAGDWVDDSRPMALHMVRSEHIEDRVDFLGVIIGADKWRLLADSDVLVLPSYDEGQPISIIEALAVGLPVISTPVGCIGEMVHDGVNGYLISPGNPMILADRLQTLYQHPELIDNMGYRSRRMFKDGFCVDKMIVRLDGVFRSVLAQGK